MRIPYFGIFAALLMAGCNGLQGPGPGERYGDQYRRGSNSLIDDPAYEDQVDITQIAGPRTSVPTTISPPAPDPRYAPARSAPRQYTPPQQYRRSVSSPPPPTVRHHTVRPQESLYSIGRRYDVTVPDLQRANGLSDTLIRPGDRLVIPQ